MTHVLKGHSGVVVTVSWAPDGTKLASGGADETVRIWDSKAGVLVSEKNFKLHPRTSHILVSLRSATCPQWSLQLGPVCPFFSQQLQAGQRLSKWSE